MAVQVSTQAVTAGTQDPNAQAITLAYEQVIGRDPTAAELALSEQQVQGGTPVSAIRGYLSTTGYATAALYSLYYAVVGRELGTEEIAPDEQLLAGGASLTDLRGYLASSQEAAKALSAFYLPVVGRAVTAPELASDQAELAAGSTVAGLRTALATSAEATGKLQATYMAVLGRAATTAEVTSDETTLATRGDLLTLRYTLTRNSGAATALEALYQSELGRALTDTMGELSHDLAILSSNSLADIRGYLSTSTEAAVALLNAYQAKYGAPATTAVLAAGEQALAGGASLQAALIQSPAASTTSTADAITLLQIYQRTFEMPETLLDLAASEQALSGGASILAAAVTNPSATAAITADLKALLGVSPIAGDVAAVEQIFGNLVPNAQNGYQTLPAAVTDAAAASPEFAAAINGAFQAAIGRPANAVELAADRSEFNLYLVQKVAGNEYPNTLTTTLGTLEGQIAALAPGAPSSVVFGEATISAQTIAGTPGLVYGLFNNDALIAAQPEYVGPGYVTGFNPLTDVLQIESRQAANFTALNLTQVGANTSTGSPAHTQINLGGGSVVFLNGVQEASLTPANFHFV